MAADRSTGATAVLVDPELDRRLRSDGYVVVPFLSAAEVAYVREGHDALTPDGEVGLVIDFMRRDRSVMDGMRSVLEPIWRELLPTLFVDHEVAVATVVTKHPGGGSAMALHDEPTFVDERHHRSHAIWIPLVDVGPELGNGHLLVLPGSDRVERGMSGYNTPVQYRPYEQAVVPRMVAVSARAGQAVIYDSRTLHASASNETSLPRPAIAASVVPRGVPLVHVVATGRAHRRVHRVPRDFYVRHHPFELDLERLPHPLLDELDDVAELDPDALAHLVGLDDAKALGPARVLVPDDLSGRVGPATAAWGPARSWPVEDLRDVRVLELESLTVGAWPSPGLEVLWAERAGSCRLEWSDDGASTPPGCLAQRAIAAGGVGRLLVLEPEGRLALQLHGDVAASLAVLEAPNVNAGLAATTRAHCLVLGTTAPLVPGDDVVVWNQGPGQLVLGVKTAEEPAGGPSRSTGAFLRRWRRSTRGG